MRLCVYIYVCVRVCVLGVAATFYCSNSDPKATG